MSRELNRQLGLLINRKGEIAYVIVGDHRGIMIPDLAEYPSSSVRFRGLRLIHSHLSEGGLSDEDLTDLALLRLDIVGALEARPDGLPGLVHLAHLIPENPAGRYWELLPPLPPSELRRDFISFIQALEGEFTRRQRSRKIETTDRAILARVEGGHDRISEGNPDRVPRMGGAGHDPNS